MVGTNLVVGLAAGDSVAQKKEPSVVDTLKVSVDNCIIVAEGVDLKFVLLFIVFL